MDHLFIINPAAGKKDSTETLERLLERLPFPRKIVHTAREGDARRMTEAAAALGKPIRIYACGGDGTLNEVVNGAAGHDFLAVTNVPMGTGNDFLKLFGPNYRSIFSNLEALAAGLPVVMYELPYLTLVQDNDAILSVPFGDADEASRQAIELLVDDGERMRIGGLAEKYAQNLAGYDYKEAWATIFASFGQPRGDVPLNRTERIMWDTLLHHYDLGTQRLARRSGGASNGGSSREAELIRASASFKIGQAVTWPARKLRTFVQCVKEHGWVYTSNVYLRRGK